MTTEVSTRFSMRQLQLISAIDDTGSLKRAAEQITMSQPRATKALQEVEAQIGIRLFNRSNRGLTATAAGEVTIRNAKRILSQIATMEHELSGLGTGDGTRLRVGTIMGAVPYVAEAIQRYLSRFPKTSIEIFEDTSAEMLRLLDRGTLDVVVGRHSVSATPEDYDHRVFHDEVLNVVANPDHPLVGKTRVTLEDLTQSRWIVYTAAMPMRLSLEKEYRLAGLPFPTALLETRSALTTMALIRANSNTIALLSGDVAAFFNNFGMAAILPVHLRSKSEPYEAITRKSQDLPEHAQAFIDELAAGSARPGWDT